MTLTSSIGIDFKEYQTETLLQDQKDKALGRNWTDSRSIISTRYRDNEINEHIHRCSTDGTDKVFERAIEGLDHMGNPLILTLLVA